MLQHSSSVMHNLLFHKGLKLVLVAVLMAAIYLITKLVTDKGRRRKQRVPKVAGINRQRRRQLSSMNRRGRGR